MLLEYATTGTIYYVITTGRYSFVWTAGGHICFLERFRRSSICQVSKSKRFVLKMFTRFVNLLTGSVAIIIQHLSLLGAFGKLKPMEAEWRIYASVHWDIIALHNGWLLDRRQAIIWTNIGILLFEPLGTKKFSDISIRIQPENE